MGSLCPPPCRRYGAAAGPDGQVGGPVSQRQHHGASRRQLARRLRSVTRAASGRPATPLPTTLPGRGGGIPSGKGWGEEGTTHARCGAAAWRRAGDASAPHTRWPPLPPLMPPRAPPLPRRHPCARRRRCGAAAPPTVPLRPPAGRRRRRRRGPPVAGRPTGSGASAAHAQPRGGAVAGALPTGGQRPRWGRGAGATAPRGARAAAVSVTGGGHAPVSHGPAPTARTGCPPWQRRRRRGRRGCAPPLVLAVARAHPAPQARASSSGKKEEN